MGCGGGLGCGGGVGGSMRGEGRGGKVEEGLGGWGCVKVWHGRGGSAGAEM